MLPKNNFARTKKAYFYLEIKNLNGFRRIKPKAQAQASRKVLYRKGTTSSKNISTFTSENSTTPLEFAHNIRFGMHEYLSFRSCLSSS